MAQLSIVNGLQAHFHQQDGLSRPGTEWVVLLRNGNTEKRLLVRTYHDHTPRATNEQHATAAVAYLSQQLDAGWSPSGADDAPSLVVPDEFVVPVPTLRVKPWWQFW
jgi:hypothetical protein